ncbi:hypothetical protein [Rhodococcoides kyotonense]|uniref:Uncharacterized protein n=1 Tax=Rhodococcoides kyotonense TaxID=398843 RepID=A0A177YFR1_9NOCA|nr:hypothetical protein [Rhodococcus kyotonensis]OAK54059.1 hypothetical protein A3K89_21390 [Rhodococcus kyotonensis]
MSENVGVAAVPDHVLDGLAEVLIDRIDQLLDRVTDRAVGAPPPGSAAWELEWSARDTAIGRARVAERSRVREELARRACVELGIAEGSAPAVPARHAPPVRPRRTKPGRVRVDEAQLTFF